MRVLLLRRLRPPRPLAAATCRCRRPLFSGTTGQCPRSGLLRPRTVPLERAAARVCREAGATIACNVLMRDVNVDVDRRDDRRIEVIANGLPLWGGAQLAVDVTLVSARHQWSAARRAQWCYWHSLSCRAESQGVPRVAALAAVPARRPGSRGHRPLEPAARFVRVLARCKARAVSPALRSAAVAASTSRWAFAAARAFANCRVLSTLTGPPPSSVTSSLRLATLRAHPSAAASRHVEPLSLLPAVFSPGLRRNALGPRNAGCKKVRLQKKRIHS